MKWSSTGKESLVNEHIGTGKSFSVLDIAKMMNGEYIHVPARNREARHTLADITKAKKLLNWEPRYSLKKYMENREYDN